MRITKIYMGNLEVRKWALENDKYPAMHKLMTTEEIQKQWLACNSLTVHQLRRYAIMKAEVKEYYRIKQKEAQE